MGSPAADMEAGGGLQVPRPQATRAPAAIPASQGSTDAPSTFPRYRCVQKPVLNSILAQDESFTVLASGPLFCAVGTTFGAVHVITLDGDFVQSFPSANQTAVVTQIAIKEELVIFTNSMGRITCWDWRSVRHLDLSPPTTTPIHSLAVSRAFSWNTGHIYYCKEPGIVLSRERNAVSRFVDTVVFEDCQTTAEFDRLFHGLPNGLVADALDDGGGDQLHLKHELVQMMACDTDYLFFPFKDHVYAYREGRNRITARFGEFPRYDPDSCDGNQTCTLGITLGGEWLMIYWGKLLLLCDRRNFDQHPFRVVHQFSATTMIQRCSLIAEQIVLCVDTTVTTRDGVEVAGGRGHRQPVVTATEQGPGQGTSRHQQDDPAAPPTPGRRHPARPALVDVVATEAQIMSSTLTFDHGFPFPAAVGRVISAQYSQAQSLTASQVGGAKQNKNNATHCHLLFPRSLFVLRILTASEQILWLIKSQRFPLAMHLCQTKYHREQVFMETAGMHANALWRKGRHEEAVRVWGEVHLPSAPAVYWKIFVDRLDAAGKIDLAVKWLPFNDRTKVGHDIYERMLISTIDNGDYLTLLARIARWPILYKIQPVLARIFAVLRVRTREAKLSIGYSTPSLPGSAAATAPGGTHGGTHGGPGFSEGGEGGLGAAGGEYKPHPNPRLATYVLLITLFKLYEFGNKFLEASQILVQLERLRMAGIDATIIDPNWSGDDESYTFALETAVKTIEKTRAPEYLSAKQLWGGVTMGHAGGTPPEIGSAYGSPRLGLRRSLSASPGAGGYFGGLQSLFVLTQTELGANSEARREILTTLLAVDCQHTLSALVEYSKANFSDAVVLMVESAASPGQIISFLEVCVDHGIILGPRHQERLLGELGLAGGARNASALL